MKKEICLPQNRFSTYLDGLIAQKKLKRQDIFQKADLPQKYGYKLLSGETHTKNRDKLLRLFIAMGLTLKETQRALALYPMPTLYPKNSRDMVLIIAINQGVSSVDTVNEWLEEYGERPLSGTKDQDLSDQETKHSPKYGEKLPFLPFIIKTIDHRQKERGYWL